MGGVVACFVSTRFGRETGGEAKSWKIKRREHNNKTFTGVARECIFSASAVRKLRLRWRENVAFVPPSLSLLAPSMYVDVVMPCRDGSLWKRARGKIYLAIIHAFLDHVGSCHRRA